MSSVMRAPADRRRRVELLVRNANTSSVLDLSSPERLRAPSPFVVARRAEQVLARQSAPVLTRPHSVGEMSLVVRSSMGALVPWRAPTELAVRPERVAHVLSRQVVPVLSQTFRLRGTAQAVPRESLSPEVARARALGELGLTGVDQFVTVATLQVLLHEQLGLDRHLIVLRAVPGAGRWDPVPRSHVIDTSDLEAQYAFGDQLVVYS